MQTINLDLSTKSVIPLLNVKQMEVGRKFKAAITEDGKPYSLAGVVFSVWYSGTSGEGNYTNIGDTSAFSVSGNNVTVELITQMVDNAGKGALCLVMNTANGDQIATWNIPYYVEAVPGAGSQEATNYYNAFQKVLEDLPYPDTTLSIPGKSADAAVVGKAFERLETITPISEDADVDSLVTPGRYACETDEIAKTLLGCDVDKAFTLDVRYANGKGPYVGQELRPRDGSSRLYRQFVKYNEILNADAKALYERMQKVKPKQYEYGENYDIYDDTVDTSWHTGDKTEYVLEKASQLHGLAKLVKDGTTKFEGVTIKLGKDIVMNEDDASTWGDAAPAYIWEPIGPSTTKYFAGTFDGQGHYISGLHGGENNNNGLFGFTYGATIKNLAVINSYFATNASNGQFLGSVVARLLSGGTLKNVYSDAILVSRQGDWFTGGIAGCIKDSKADSCVFAGTIFSDELTEKNNKYIGGITGGSDSGGHSAELTNCLFIGAIKSNDSGVGGIAGMLGPGSVVDGCVSAGTIEGNARQVGAVLGWVSGTGNHAITNCYYSAELGRNLYAGGDAGSVVETTDSKKLPAECMKYSMIPGKWAKVYDSENKPTIEEIGAAPDGYGLGALGSTYAADLNACIRNGWYRTDNYSTNVPYGSYFKYATVFVTARTSKIIVQRLIAPEAASFHSEMLRYTQDGGATWVDEWVNPPMGIGVEYRTTERYGGKPVYYKLVDCGSGPNNTEKNIEHGAENAIVFDFGGYMRLGNGALSTPWLKYSNLSANSDSVIINTSSDYSRYTAFVWIKYFKTTD